MNQSEFGSNIVGQQVQNKFQYFKLHYRQGALSLKQEKDKR